MKLAIISDTHFHNWKTFGIATNEDWGWSKRLDEQIQTVFQAMKIAKDIDADYFVHGADWIHSVGSMSNEVANALDYVLARLPLPLITGSGNHDTLVRRLPKAAHIITPVIAKLAGKAVQVPNVKFVNYYDEIDYNTLKDYDLVILHKTPIGSRVGHYTFTDGVDWKTLARQNKQVAFGHVHQKQILSENCFVIGAPYHLTFGDIGERGMWVVDTEKDKPEFIKLDYPEFITVATPDLVKEDGNYYRVLNSEKKIDSDRIIATVVPKKFDERIKSTEFNSILREWLEINGKDETYLLAISDVLTEKLSLVKSFYKGRLAKVRIKDFCSVEDIEYTVNKGFTLVVGEGETFDSNGVGKTTVVGESLCWCLFDETTKGLTGNDVIRDRPTHQKDCMVEVELKGSERSYLIRRKRKGGLEIYDVNNRKANLVSDMKQAERQKYLEALLGFNKQVFMAACYFSQENLMMLTGLGDADKTNMVTDLLGFETYDDLYGRVGNKITVLESELQALDERKVELDKNQAVATNNVTFMEQSLENISKQSSELRVRVTELQQKVKDIEKKIAELKEVKLDEETDYDKELSELYELKESHGKRDVEIESEIERLRGLIDAEKQKQYRLQATEIQYQKDIKKLEEEINKLRNLELGVKCDKCGALVTKENVDTFIQEKSSTIVGTTTAEQTCSNALKEIASTVNALEGRVDEQRVEKTTVKERLQKVETFIKETIAERESHTRKIQEAKLELTRFESEIKTNERLIEDYNRQLTGLEFKAKEFETQKLGYDKELKVINEKLKENEWRIGKAKKGIDVLAFWKVAFSPKGIRALLLDSFCNEINASVNRFLSQVSSGSMSIVMKPTSVLKSGEQRNKIGMDILLDSLPRSYKSLSGGEKRRVDVSLCFGLNSWVSERYQIPNGLLGVIIFDEVFSFMDKTGEEAMANLLFEEGVTKALFVIDHALNLQSFADQIWKVKKSNQISMLERM